MPVIVDEEGQEASVVRASIETHKDALAAKGYGADRVSKFDSLHADMSAKTSAQRLAQVTLFQRTKDQHDAMTAGSVIITRLQDAASSAYGRGSPVLKEFLIGVNKPRAVGKMETTLEYLSGVAARRAADLNANGFSKDDIDQILTVYGNLVSADNMQKNAKKIRNSATEARDNAVGAMKAEIFRVRKFVKGAFSKDNAMLEEFKPIKRGGKRGGGTSPNPPTPPPAK